MWEPRFVQLLGQVALSLIWGVFLCGLRHAPLGTGISPDTITFTSLIKCCAKLGDVSGFFAAEG